MRLEGRVVAVAGAGGGLGPAVVAAVRAEGARVAVADVSEEKLEALEADHAAPVNLLAEDGARMWRNAVVGDLGRVDALLHLVGGWRGGTPLGEESLADWAELHPLLVQTVQHTSRAFLEDLRSAGERGRFALVSAKAAGRPTSTNAAYAAAKAAAEAWTLAVADELSGSGATANVVVVTAIGTAKPSFTPPEALADALCWLCSDAAGKMTGQRLALHGP